jgi:hypothetical protein
MPHWKKQDQCFEDEQVEMIDLLHGHKIMKNGKPVIKAWPHDKPTAQISYEDFMKIILNPDTNEYYTARNKGGGIIKGTGAKHIVTQIIRIKRKDGNEFLYSLGRIEGYDAFGNRVTRSSAKPEVWTRRLFDHQRIYDHNTNSTKVQTIGTLGTEDVYEMPFNEKNLKELVSLRANDSDITFTIKD